MGEAGRNKLADSVKQPWPCRANRRSTEYQSQKHLQAHVHYAGECTLPRGAWPAYPGGDGSAGMQLVGEFGAN